MLTWIKRLFGRRPASSPAPITPATTKKTITQIDPAPSEDSDTEPVWVVVANVVFEHPHGSGGLQKRFGAKHFAPGAKAYVVSFYWGQGAERVTVVGRHRKSHRYICIDMPSKHLANWRAELAYNPWAIRKALEHGGRKTKEEAKNDVARIIRSFGESKQPYAIRTPTAE